MTDLSEEMRDKLDAATFRRLLSHLDSHKEVQNIDLMILADFCRNCLANWRRDAAAEEGIEMTTDDARARIYGMPYGDWKEKFQTPATPEQMAAYEERRGKK